MTREWLIFDLSLPYYMAQYSFGIKEKKTTNILTKISQRCNIDYSITLVGIQNKGSYIFKSPLALCK